MLSRIVFAVYADDIRKCCSVNRGHHIILYADDILLIISAVTELEKLLHICENEFAYIDDH